MDNDTLHPTFDEVEPYGAPARFGGPGETPEIATLSDHAMREAVARALNKSKDTTEGLLFDPDDWHLWKQDADAALRALAPHLDTIRAQARREALEEAARVCDDVWPTSPRKAAAIRKLIDATSA